jgi:hypothetical protein
MSSKIDSASASARYALNLKALAEEKDQKKMLRKICAAQPGEYEGLRMELARIAPMARSGKVSEAARIYAAVRFLQDGQDVAKPAAWVETVAKRAEASIRRGEPWNTPPSEPSGRSLSRSGLGGGGAFGSGRL